MFVTCLSTSSRIVDEMRTSNIIERSFFFCWIFAKPFFWTLNFILNNAFQNSVQQPFSCTRFSGFPFLNKFMTWMFRYLKFFSEECILSDLVVPSRRLLETNSSYLTLKFTKTNDNEKIPKIILLKLLIHLQLFLARKLI